MSCSSNESDFNDDDDPDRIEIPGGGKDLATLAYFNNFEKTEFQSNIDTESSKIENQFNVESIPALLMQPNLNHIITQSNFLDEEDVEDEEMGVAETYADYMPMKLKFGNKHPDPVVETSSLSSVEPTDIWYKLSIPNEIIISGSLSALQLESITYASQQHENILPDGSRAGFLIGDGAGVGKGRTIAGIVYENYLNKKKRAIWISVSNDLKYDAERDLKDIGASIPVYPLSKFKYDEISSCVNGNIKKGVIFGTYSALIGESTQGNDKYNSRLNQLLHWFGENSDGIIIFDECHRAKNLSPTRSSKPTKTGLAVLELQNRLPNARIVYASATGASEPRNMAYMVRLGIWGKGTPFLEFDDFITAVEKRGVGAMEIIAMDMKLRGMYIARQLSFYGVTFKIEEVPISHEFINMYNKAVNLWVDAMKKFQEAADLIDASSRMKKVMWSQFWSSHQRFFKYLCIAAKVKHAVAISREALKCGKCVVIGLQSTGEARTLDQLERDEGELNDFVSTAKGVLQSLIEKHFPAPNQHRVHHILGLRISTCSQLSKSVQSNFKCSNKREVIEEITQTVSKKKCLWSPLDQIYKEKEDNRIAANELDISISDNDEDLKLDELSNISSDYNPFESDSDSDVDPWDRREKKNISHLPNKEKIFLKSKNKISLLSTQSNILKPESNKKQPNYSSELIPTECIQIKPQNQVFPNFVNERACIMKNELLRKIEELGQRLPPNTLDHLIDELGGPENVAEMTGRKGRIVQTEDGEIQYESRLEPDIPLEILNVTEKQRFMNGEKTVAIISEAASSGISLQSDRRARNQMRRVHITLELPWSADRAIQQFGRTHRSNQVNAPEYIFLISNLAGERRFASTVAKRLESLGALTHGDRRATQSRDLSQFNIDNKYGRAALETTLKTLIGYESPLVPPPADYNGDFFKDTADALSGVGIFYNSDNTVGKLSLDKDYNNIQKFLNRILGIPVELQNRLFKYFTDTLNAIINKAKKLKHFDMGILDMSMSAENIRRVKLYRFLHKHATGKALTELHIVQIERGLKWSEALDYSTHLNDVHEGFYLSYQSPNGKHSVALAVSVKLSNEKKFQNTIDNLYMLYRPNIGLQIHRESISELRKKYKKVDLDKAKSFWIHQYEASASTCSHAYWKGICKNKSLGMGCEVGLRCRSYNILSGSVLSIWSRIESVLAAGCEYSFRMQVIRLRTFDGLKIVGILIPPVCMKHLKEALSIDAEKFDEER